MYSVGLTKEITLSIIPTIICILFSAADMSGAQIDVGGDQSSVRLQFTVPQQSEPNAIENGELWLFPSFNTPLEDRWYKLSFGFIIRLREFDNVVETRRVLYWRSTDECIKVNLTKHTKKIASRIKRKNLNETLVTVDVTLHHKEVVLAGRMEEEWQRTCSALISRSSNTSFLVVKYFSDEEESQSDSARKRRTTVEDPVPSVDAKPSGCSLVPFNVNLQEVYGDWIVSPTEPVNVGACSGTCDINSNSKLFSARAIFKDRLINMKDTLPDLPSHDLDVSCVPLTLKPLVFLIHVETTDYYVLVEYPIKATSCGCR